MNLRYNACVTESDGYHEGPRPRACSPFPRLARKPSPRTSMGDSPPGPGALDRRPTRSGPQCTAGMPGLESPVYGGLPPLCIDIGIEMESDGTARRREVDTRCVLRHERGGKRNACRLCRELIPKGHRGVDPSVTEEAYANSLLKLRSNQPQGTQGPLAFSTHGRTPGPTSAAGVWMSCSSYSKDRLFP